MLDGGQASLWHCDIVLDCLLKLLLLALGKRARAVRGGLPVVMGVWPLAYVLVCVFAAAMCGLLRNLVDGTFLFLYIIN